MNKYKLPFHGFVYVEAENEGEALDKADNDESVYEEREWDPAEEVDEFGVSFLGGGT